jgi:two-component system heavy metal sensor histidine kinase CusS
MSLKSTEPRSIASQLILLFTPAAALLLCATLGGLYWIIVQHAFEEDTAVLLDKVGALQADLLMAGGPRGLHEELDAPHTGERAAYSVRVLDAAGQVLEETPGMSRLLPTTVFPQPNTGVYSVQHPKNFRRDRKLFSLAAVKVPAGGQTFTLQVAQDRSGDADFMREFAMLIGIVLAFGILASAGIALIVTRRGLRPLAEMTRSFQRVGPTHLDERVPPKSWPRELQPLATAFDEMLERLEDSFTRLSQFSADLAHELRTPIANLLGEAEVALTRPRTPEEYRAVIESSVSECERLSGLVDNLLFLARAEAADRHIKPEMFDGRTAVEKIVAMYEPIAEEQGVRLTSGGGGEIYADPMLFSRALNNLLENALRFTPAGGSISISIDAESTASRLSVQDTGSGIPAEHLPRVFDRFYRVDSARSSRGSGLGLALVKSIVQLHGGTAKIESETDRGTRVTLTFPKASTTALPV